MREAALCEGAPPGDGGHVADVLDAGVGRETDGPDVGVAAVVHRGFQFQNREVVIKSTAVVVWMDLNLDDVHPETVCLTVGVVVMFSQENLTRISQVGLNISQNAPGAYLL